MSEPREEARARARDLAIMQDPARWPFKRLLPLCHRTKKDGFHYPVTAVLAVGHGTRVFYANIGDFDRASLQTRDAFSAALQRLESVAYISFAAIAKEWRVD